MLNSLKPNPSCITLIITHDSQFVSQRHESNILQMLNAAQQNNDCNSGNTPFVLQSYLPGMCACMVLIGKWHRTELHHLVLLQILSH